MKRKRFLFVLVAAAVLFAFKLAFPEKADMLAEAASNVFRSDINYRQVFNDLSNSLSPAEESAAPLPEQTIIETKTVSVDYGYIDVQSGAISGERLGEVGENRGEEPLEPVVEIPPAVAAFLESQQEYKDVELPENVSYAYAPFPLEYFSPVEGYNSSGFGYRIHPIHGDLRFHYGTDFAAWTGEYIYAFAEGTVSYAGWCESYGNYITISHPEGWESLYAHCSVLYVETGDEVKGGDKIALVGDTGRVTGPHLHFELLHEGEYTNPEYYVN